MLYGVQKSKSHKLTCQLVSIHLWFSYSYSHFGYSIKVLWDYYIISEAYINFKDKYGDFIPIVITVEVSGPGWFISKKEYFSKWEEF